MDDYYYNVGGLHNDSQPLLGPPPRRARPKGQGKSYRPLVKTTKTAKAMEMSLPDAPRKSMVNDTESCVQQWLRRLLYAGTMILLFAGIITFSTLIILKVQSFVVAYGEIRNIAQENSFCVAWRPMAMHFDYNFNYHQTLYHSTDNFCLQSPEVNTYQQVFQHHNQVPVFLDPVNPQYNAMSLVHLVIRHPICLIYSISALVSMFFLMVGIFMLPCSGFV